MAERDTFVEIDDGDQLNEGYFNGIHTAVTDTSSGHDHDGTDSKAFGWVHYDTQDFTDTDLTSTGYTWSTLPNKRQWKLIFWFWPNYTGSEPGLIEYIALQINEDTGNNYNSFYDGGNTGATSSCYLAATWKRDSSSEAGGCNAEVVITNIKGEAAYTGYATPIRINSGGYYQRFFGGYWKDDATITSLKIFAINNRGCRGKVSLYYHTETED